MVISVLLFHGSSLHGLKREICSYYAMKKGKPEKKKKKIELSAVHAGRPFLFPTSDWSTSPYRRQRQRNRAGRYRGHGQSTVALLEMKFSFFVAIIRR